MLLILYQAFRCLPHWCYLTYRKQIIANVQFTLDSPINLLIGQTHCLNKKYRQQKGEYPMTRLIYLQIFGDDKAVLRNLYRNHVGSVFNDITFIKVNQAWMMVVGFFLIHLRVSSDNYHIAQIRHVSGCPVKRNHF